MRAQFEFDMKETIGREDALRTVIVPYGNPTGTRGVSKKNYPREREYCTWGKPRHDTSQLLLINGSGRSCLE